MDVWRTETLTNNTRTKTTQAAERLLQTLVAFDTTPTGQDHVRCVDWLTDQLTCLGFEVYTTDPTEGPPALKAVRAGNPTAGTLVMYGHYDVGDVSDPQSINPLRVREEHGRWIGLGVADDKGPLACRLTAMGQLGREPTVIWLIQGEEETGSQVARQHFPSWMAGIDATAWLDETGYHDITNGSLRLIACGTSSAGEPAEPDGQLERLLVDLTSFADGRGRAVEPALRRLNKALVPGGCPFQANLPTGARYLALGVNDTASQIHRAGESVPIWAFDEHIRQLQVLWRWLSSAEDAV